MIFLFILLWLVYINWIYFSMTLVNHLNITDLLDGVSFLGKIHHQHCIVEVYERKWLDTDRCSWSINNHLWWEILKNKDWDVKGYKRMELTLKSFTLKTLTFNHPDIFNSLAAFLLKSTNVSATTTPDLSNPVLITFIFFSSMTIIWKFLMLSHRVEDEEFKNLCKLTLLTVDYITT